MTKNNDKQTIMNPVFPHIVTDSQNTIISANHIYRFKKRKPYTDKELDDDDCDEKTCKKCDLLDECSFLSSEDLFPFPCVSEHRNDKRDGYFKRYKTPEEVFIRQLIILFILFVVLIAIVEFDCVPSWLNNLLWHSK